MMGVGKCCQSTKIKRIVPILILSPPLSLSVLSVFFNCLSIDRDVCLKTGTRISVEKKHPREVG